jgi:hypothetical protein
VVGSRSKQVVVFVLPIVSDRIELKQPVLGVSTGFEMSDYEV